MQKRKPTDMLTARTFAKEKGISYTTVMAWLRDGLIPGATQEMTPMGVVWQIPVASLDKVERRKPGPKPGLGAGASTDDQVTAAQGEAAQVEPKRRTSNRAAAKKALKKMAKRGGAK
jgi:hypothetical protein